MRMRHEGYLVNTMNINLELCGLIPMRNEKKSKIYNSLHSEGIEIHPVGIRSDIGP